MWYAVKVVCDVWEDEEPVITSTWEGTHLPWSMHYRKRALDFRLPRKDVTKKWQTVRGKLGKDYDVVMEHGHVHIEYDPKKE
jgi:hypothetical protein